MPPKNTKYVVAIGGPTGVGKTALAIALAQRFRTVIISADSRQMYRQMTIGTAKPSTSELHAVKHYFIDHLDITEEYSVGKYEEDALDLIRQLHAHHDLVLLTGGSGLYLKAVLAGLDTFPEVPSSVKAHWDERLEKDGLAVLQKELARQDPEYFARVDQQNPRRVTRALSVITASGRPFSSFMTRSKKTRPFTALRIFCNIDRGVLYERINERVDAMIEQGLVEEARQLLPQQACKALQTVGYQELFRHFDGAYPLEQAVEKIKQHTRNYAKRQVTWFRNQGAWIEFNPPDLEAIAEHIVKHTK